MSSDGDQKKTSVMPKPNGPYVVKGIEDFRNANGPLEPKPQMSLCRCGESSNKPFCDGTHNKIGFNSDKLDGRIDDKRDNYEGENITVHDNRGTCAHAGYCTDGLPSVFKLKQEPWIDPNGAPAEDVAKQVRACPSGAISYSQDRTEHRDQKRDPAIFVVPNGPYVFTGGPEIIDAKQGEGASAEHFTLCRCGGSKNKPFCDGTHWTRKFDEHSQ